ncbi:MAG: response regulator [Spirochaetaceae bacterium]|nr:response regulator [Spirochaetaceae bacterium]
MSRENRTPLNAAPGGKVLVVDDLPANLQVARGLFASCGLAIETAASGQEAIELVKTNDYDLLFMDHMMPEMDGVEAAAVIKNDLRKPVPIIAMTANTQQGMREFYLEKGFADYLSKPIIPAELGEVLDRWINTSRSPAPAAQSPIAAEMEAQRLDMLNHYRVSFESGRVADTDTPYFERFTAAVKSFDAAGMSPDLREQAAALTEAGQRGDAKKIREILPAFYAALRKRREKEGIPEDETLAAVLPKLKKAVLAEEAETAEAAMRELGTLSLGSSGRELYFQLYDLLLTGEYEKAAGAINLWEKKLR